MAVDSYQEVCIIAIACVLQSPATFVQMGFRGHWRVNTSNEPSQEVQRLYSVPVAFGCVCKIEHTITVLLTIATGLFSSSILPKIGCKRLVLQKLHLYSESVQRLCFLHRGSVCWLVGPLWSFFIKSSPRHFVFGSNGIFFIH